MSSLVDAAREDVIASAFFTNLRTAFAAAEHRFLEVDHAQVRSWSSVSSMVVYGLGSLSVGLNSRYQLALAHLLRNFLPGLSSPAEVYDPVFAAADKKLLDLSGFKVVDHDEEGRRVVRGPTLFYLPHCEAELCDNILHANWDPKRLSDVIILGNSFTSYVDRWSVGASRHSTLYRPHGILTLCHLNCVEELPVDDANFPVASAFNDLSLHFFPRWDLKLPAWPTDLK